MHISMIVLTLGFALAFPAQASDPIVSQRFADGRLSACTLSFDAGDVRGVFEIQDVRPGMPLAMLRLGVRQVDGSHAGPASAYLFDGETRTTPEEIAAPVVTPDAAVFGFHIGDITSGVVAHLMDHGSIRFGYADHGADVTPVTVSLGEDSPGEREMRTCLETLVPASAI